MSRLRQIPALQRPGPGRLLEKTTRGWASYARANPMLPIRLGYLGVVRRRL